MRCAGRRGRLRGAAAGLAPPAPAAHGFHRRPFAAARVGAAQMPKRVEECPMDSDSQVTTDRDR